MKKLEKDGISASEKRILVTKWVAKAWIQMYPPPGLISDAVLKAFRYTGLFLFLEDSNPGFSKMNDL